MKHCCNTHRVFTILLLVASFAIAGCGQKGPLEYTAAQQERIDIRDKERKEKQAGKQDSMNEETNGSQESSDTDSAEESRNLDEDPPPQN